MEMRKISIDDMESKVFARRRELGWTAEDDLRGRNGGLNRTPEKRALIDLIRETAAARGLPPW